MYDPEKVMMTSRDLWADWFFLCLISFNSETKSSFSRCLSVLISHLSRTNIQLATTLDYWQKQHDLRDEMVTGQNLELLDGVDLSAIAFQQSVMDTPTVHTRAGLYIYLNAMVNAAVTLDFFFFSCPCSQTETNFTA